MSEGKSIRWIVIASMLFVAYLGWGFLAGSYSGSANADGVVIGRRGTAGLTLMASAIYSFIATSVMQLPAFFQVISWHFSHRIWLPILIVLVEIGIAAGGVGLKRLEENLSRPPKRRR